MSDGAPVSWSATPCWTSASGVSRFFSTQGSRMIPNSPTNHAPRVSRKRVLPAPGSAAVDGPADGDAAGADGVVVGGFIVDMGVYRSPGAGGSPLRPYPTETMGRPRRRNRGKRRNDKGYQFRPAPRTPAGVGRDRDRGVNRIKRGRRAPAVHFSGRTPTEAMR